MSLIDTIDSLGDRARTALSALTPRDRALTGVMAAVLILAIGFFALSGMAAARRAKRAAIADARQAQAQVNVLLSEHLELQGEAEALQARLQQGAGFSPGTWFEDMGNTMGLSENFKDNRESRQSDSDYFREQQHELKIDAVDLRLLVDVLYRIENAPPPIRVRELRVKPTRKDKTKLDVNMSLAILKPLEGA